MINPTISRRTLRRAGITLCAISLVGMTWLFLSIGARAETPFATTPQGRTAQLANAADAATTAAALSTVQGATELNPLAAPTLIAKHFIAKAYEDNPCHQRKAVLPLITASSTGAAANNAAILLGAVSQAAIPVGIVVAIVTWNMSDRDCAVSEAEKALIDQWRRDWIAGDWRSMARYADAELVQAHRLMFARHEADGIEREAEYEALDHWMHGIMTDAVIRFGDREERLHVRWRIDEGKITGLGWWEYTGQPRPKRGLI